ncbi:MAG: alpha/beta hydrolase [Mangrovicoccus sp.]|nr:alpha/beta hydrolase [Mangrovicoccus sp.]
MAQVSFQGHDVCYHLDGPKGAPVIAFINGLTQYSDLWTAYTQHFTDKGFRVLRFDMLGQGQSEKPALGVSFDTHWQSLEAILDHAEIETAHVAGISYGGTVALQFACNRPERCASLIPMSCFAEMPPQLYQLGCGLYDALINSGLPSLQRWLMPMNMSDEWLEGNRDALPAMMRRGYAINDLYALQNLMESLLDFKPITDQLGQITCPTMILNGEFDFFTPRKCHEVLRQKIPHSRLVIVQNAYHAFTLEHPAVTMRLIEAFISGVTESSWTGDQGVWVACGDVSEPAPWLPYEGDHLRAIALPQSPAAAPAAEAKPAPPKAKSTRARKPRASTGKAPARSRKTTKTTAQGGESDAS